MGNNSCTAEPVLGRILRLTGTSQIVAEILRAVTIAILPAEVVVLVCTCRSVRSAPEHAAPFMTACRRKIVTSSLSIVTIAITHIGLIHVQPLAGTLCCTPANGLNPFSNNRVLCHVKKQDFGYGVVPVIILPWTVCQKERCEQQKRQNCLFHFLLQQLQYSTIHSYTIVSKVKSNTVLKMSLSLPVIRNYRQPFLKHDVGLGRWQKGCYRDLSSQLLKT